MSSRHRSTVTWTNEDTFKLIELYKAQRFLWDMKSLKYRNKFERLQAYDDIATQLMIPELTGEDVRNKIKSLRTFYHSVKRKFIETGQGVNKKDRMSIFFNALEPIMKLVKGDILNFAGDYDGSERERQDKQNNLYEVSSSDEDTYVVHINDKYLDEVHKCQTVSASEVTDNLEPASKRSRFEESVREDSAKQSVATGKTDEFQMFANNIAAQLRTLPLDMALDAQIKIQSLIAGERITLFNKRKEVVEVEKEIR